MRVFSHLHGLVIDEVAMNPGLSFNRLAARLRGKISRVKLFRLVKQLKEWGVLVTARDSRHKQRILLSVDKKFLAIFLGLSCNLEEAAGAESVVRMITGLVRKYNSMLSELERPIEREYARYRLMVQISKLLRFNTR